MSSSLDFGPEFEPIREQLLTHHLCHSLDETMPKLRSEETSSLTECEQGSASLGSGDHTGGQGIGGPIVTNLAMMQHQSGSSQNP